MFPAYFIFPSSIPTKASSKLWHRYGYTYERGREKDVWEVWICLGYFQAFSLRSYLHPMENSEIVLFRNKSAHISLFFPQYSSFFITRDICMKTVFFFFFNFFLKMLGVHLSLLIIPSLPSPSEVIIFWLHYICSRPTAGALLIKMLKLCREKNRSAHRKETSKKAWPGQKWGAGVQSGSLPLWAMAVLDHCYFC